MKVLIIGAGGQVGKELVLAAKELKIDLTAFGRAGLDITNPERVAGVICEHQPTIVINAAAYTAVDKAEDEPELAERVNSDAVGVLAAVCHMEKIPLIHISTDYVFDGGADAPYDELSAVHPTGVYGKTKLSGEQKIQSLCERYIIMRTSWVFGRFEQNFVKTMLRLSESHQTISVVADQQGKPTCARDIANALMAVAIEIDKGATDWGVYHFAGDVPVTWHHFAETIFDLAAKPTKVNAITTADYPTKAKRPAYSVLDTTKIQKTFGIEVPSWKASLAEVINELKERS